MVGQIYCVAAPEKIQNLTMARSLKKGPWVDPKLLEKLERAGSEEPIKTWSRDSMIIPKMVGRTFLVHNGRDFITVKVREEMVGHRLGEFALTRKFVRHGGKLQRAVEEQERAKPS